LRLIPLASSIAFMLSMVAHAYLGFTGTQAGDPTEANAVGEVFSTVRSDDDPLWLGAVKPNVGHLEAGSGMASLFKAILVLENGVIPPNACFEKLNPRIEAERFHLRVSILFSSPFN
jgi:acyl transferase domain-containing protein